MAYSNSFGDFPTEIIDMLTPRLTLSDIKNLRLVCKDAKDRFTGCRAFLKHLKTIVTDLSRPSLNSLGIFLSDPRVSAAVSNLTIVAAVYGPWDGHKGIYPPRWHAWLRQRKEEEADRINSRNENDVIVPLTTILQNLKQLQTLSLEPAVVIAPGQIIRPGTHSIMEPPYSTIRPQSPAILKLVLAAVSHSKVDIHRLNVFQTHRATSSIVSEGITAAASGVRDLSVKDDLALNTIKELALSFSPRLPGYFPDQHVRDSEFHGIAGFLSLFPGLETLDLHMHNTLPTYSLEPARIFNAIASSVKLPRLRRCTLRGLITDEKAILKFLENHRDLEALEMRYITLVAGTWTSIFALLGARVMPNMNYLHLSGLNAQGCMVDLKPENRELMNKEIPSWKWDHGMFLPHQLESSGHIFHGIFRREFLADVLQRGFELRGDRHFGAPFRSQETLWPDWNPEISAEFGVLHARVCNHVCFHGATAK